MTLTVLGTAQDHPATASPEKRLYLIGAVSAWTFVVLVLAPVALVVAGPVPPADGAGILAFVAQHRFVYLVELTCFVGLAAPALVVFVVLTFALRGADRGIVALGGTLGVVSETIALALGSSPQSLHGGLVVLSDAWSTTVDPERRQALVAAAEALVAATNAVSWAGILTAAAIGVLSLQMRSGGFGAVTAYLGCFTGAIGVVSETFRPMIGAAYMLYGLLLPLWFGLVGWHLWRLARRPSAAVTGSDAATPRPGTSSVRPRR